MSLSQCPESNGYCMGMSYVILDVIPGDHVWPGAKTMLVSTYYVLVCDF